MNRELSVETTGETVGEAKLRALRELELLAASLDKDSVRFHVLSEGRRGLLGVGYEPARVLATADAVTRAVEAASPVDESEAAGWMGQRPSKASSSKAREREPGQPRPPVGAPRPRRSS